MVVEGRFARFYSMLIGQTHLPRVPNLNAKSDPSCPSTALLTYKRLDPVGSDLPNQVPHAVPFAKSVDAFLDLHSTV